LAPARAGIISPAANARIPQKAKDRHVAGLLYWGCLLGPLRTLRAGRDKQTRQAAPGFS
jgi:hypothetical protein